MWVGAYHPWLAPDAPGLVWTADAFAVDVPCPTANDCAAQEAADRDGYRWQSALGAPFGSHEPWAAPGVLGAEWLLDDPAPQHALVLPE